MNTLKFQDLGQIKQADIRLGDLNVFVGRQATGKSVFLQLFKLLVDAGPVIAEFRRYKIDPSGRIHSRGLNPLSAAT